MPRKPKIPVAEIALDDSQFKQLVKSMPTKAQRGVDQATLLGEAGAVDRAPERSGNLINSSTVEFRGSGYAREGVLSFTAPYALFVHEGTGIFGPKEKPFVIEPVKKKALFFPGLKHPVKRVVHKGQKGQPFMKEALEEDALPKLSELIFG